MSSISLNTGQQSLYTLLNNSATGAAQNPLLELLGNGAVTNSTAASTLVADGAQFGASSGAQNGDLFQQLQQAVTSALTSAQSTGSTPDANAIIQQAITSVLQGSNTSDPAGENDSDNSAASGTSADPTDAESSTQSFYQTLKAHGVDPQQFRNDLLAALTQGQTGPANLSTAFSSFPTGLTVDTAA